MRKFNIEPGMTSWPDQPEDYKQAYYKQKSNEKLKKLGTYWRVFDPLKPVSKKPLNCVFHIPIYVEEKERDSDSKGALEDFIASRRCIELFRQYEISKIPDFKLELVVSINGNIENQKFIDYFKSIDQKWLSNKVFCKVFQRHNVGYQWGGFHDVWMRYKDSGCKWFATMESDHRIMFDDWFDKILEYVADGKFTFGKCQNNRPLNPKWPIGVYVSDNTWRNADGSNRINTTPDDLIHTCGAFHFCHHDVLAKMDRAFGCFTFAMGCNHTIDGVIQGEIGFCQKIKALDYSIKSREIEFLVRPMRGADCEYNPKKDYEVIKKEIATWED